MKKKKHLLALLAGLLSLLMVVSLTNNIQVESVRAASSSELEDQLEELENKNDQLNAQLEELRAGMNENLEGMEALVAQKNMVDQEIALLYQQAELMNTQISAYSLLIADKQKEVDAAEKRLNDLQEKNKLRIRAMEENGTLSYWSVLSEANSFSEMLDRLEIIGEIAKSDEECLRELSAAAQEVAAAKDNMTAEQDNLKKKRDSLDAVEAELAAKREETDKLIIDIKARHDEYEALIENSEKLQEDLMAEIAAKEDELEDAKYQEWLATSVPQAGTGTTTNGITWLMPCSYSALTSPFGYRVHPLGGDWRFHSGVDLAGAYMTPIYATRSGYVAVAAFQPGGAGNYVSLNHGDGFKSIYMHMEYYVVTYSQYVEAGQLIGYMGSTGGSTGVHLHFGISYNGNYVNPAEYLNF